MRSTQYSARGSVHQLQWEVHKTCSPFLYHLLPPVLPAADQLLHDPKQFAHSLSHSAAKFKVYHHYLQENHLNVKNDFLLLRKCKANSSHWSTRRKTHISQSTGFQTGSRSFTWYAYVSSDRPFIPVSQLWTNIYCLLDCTAIHERQGRAVFLLLGWQEGRGSMGISLISSSFP